MKPHWTEIFRIQSNTSFKIRFFTQRVLYSINEFADVIKQSNCSIKLLFYTKICFLRYDNYDIICKTLLSR